MAIKLRQPLILAFIIVGVMAGPSGFGIITSHGELELLASFGVTLLLFIVGLKLDIDSIKAFGPVVLLLGLGQMLMTAGLGVVLAYALGMTVASAIFVAVAMAFSSTIIIIKSLSDKDEFDSLYGRIAVGILIVQDLVVVLAIITLSSLDMQHTGSQQLLREVGLLLVKGAGFLVVIGLFMRFALPFLLRHAAKSRELLVLFGLAWAVILAASADALGFGKEIGGFLAGVSLASTHYRESIASRLDTVRNLLLVFFFINLGSALQFDTLSTKIVPALVLSAFVLMVKPLIVMVLMGGARFRKRTSFMTAVTMGQVSEFSLILAALAHGLGYIDNDIVGLIILISLITIGLSTYMLTSASAIYNKLAPVLGIFEREMVRPEDDSHESNDAGMDVIVYGYGRHGAYLAGLLKEKGLKTLGIDSDPRKVMSPHHHLTPLRYGDAEDAEFIKTLPLDRVKWVVSTIPHHDTNRMLVAALREHHYQGKIALSAYHEHELESARKLQVDMLFVPYRDAAQSAAEKIVALCDR
tara:strand:- start:659 stop:2236 length:1578 start_codon:yes stop_codon:yes gene_type:complete